MRAASDPRLLPIGGTGARLATLLELTRWPNVITGGAYAVLGAYLAAGPAALASPMVLRAVLVTMLVIGFGNAINDYADVEADRIATPERPIPSGRMSRLAAGRIAALLAMASLLMAATLTSSLFLYAAGAVLLSAAYSLRLKAIPLVGNVAVAALAASLLPYAALATGGIPGIVWFGSALTLLYIVPHEILLSLEDEHSDRAVAVASTASSLGQRTAIALYRMFAILFCVVALGAPLAAELPPGYLLIIPSAIAPTLAVLACTRGRPTHSRIKLAAKLAGMAWWGSLVPIALLRS